MKNQKEVGGWLLLFCISLTILSPLITIYTFITSYGATYTLFDEFPGLESILIVDGILSSFVMFFSIRAGIALWKIAPNAVKTAKNYLLIYLGYSAIAVFLPYMAGLPSYANDEMLPETLLGIFRTLIYFGIWYSYLNVSVRVKETYISTELNPDNIHNEDVVSGDLQIFEIKSDEVKINSPSNWYHNKTREGKVTQVVISAPISTIKDTDFGMIVLPADKFPVLSTQPWCTGFVRMSGKPIPYQLLRVDEFDEDVKKSNITIAFSFCKMSSGCIFMINARIDDESLGKRVSAKFPFIAPLNKPVAEWLVSLNDSYSIEMLEDAFNSSTLNIIVANSLGIESERMDNYGRMVADEYPGPCGHHERLVELDDDILRLLKSELKSLKNFHYAIPDSNIDFQEANRELSAIFPFDKDPIIPQK
jgi:hypothetical protein